MEQYFIDKFVMPSASYFKFRTQMNINRAYMRKLDGFIEESVYERTDEDGSIIIISISEWENYDKMIKAKGAMQNEFKRIGFNPLEFREELKVTMERAVYEKMDNPSLPPV